MSDFALSKKHFQDENIGLDYDGVSLALVPHHIYIKSNLKWSLSFEMNVLDDTVLSGTLLYILFNFQIANYLVGNGAYVNVKDSMLDTPLHLCCYKGFIDIIDMLIQVKILSVILIYSIS